MQTAKLGIAVDLNDSLAQLKQLKELMSALGTNTTETFAKAATAAKTSAETVVATTKKAAEERVTVTKKTEEEIAAVEGRVRKAKEKGLDEVRQKIFEFEEQTRKLRLESAYEQDANRKKEISAETKKVNTELQLYRSAEKEMMGARTFSEQLEKNFKPPNPKGIVYNTLFGGGEYKTELKNLEKESKEVDEKLAAQEQELQKKLASAESAEAKEAVEIEAKKDKQILEQHKARIEKEIAETQELNAESAEKSEGGILKSATGAIGGLGLGGLAAGGAVAGATVALTKLYEVGEDVHKRQMELEIGFQTMGQSAEQAKKSTDDVMKSSKSVALEMGLTHQEIETATATYLKMGGTTTNLKQTQEELAAAAKRWGMDTDAAAKLYAKAMMGNTTALTRYMPELKGVTDKAKAMEIIHKKLAGTITSMKNVADQDPMARIKETFSQLMESGGKLIFGILDPIINVFSKIVMAVQPLIDIITELGSIIGEMIEQALEPVTEIFQEIGSVIGDLMPVIQVIMKAALIPLKAIIWEITTVIKFFIWEITTVIGWLKDLWEAFDNTFHITEQVKEAYEAISNAVSSFIGWLTKAIDTVKSVGASLLSVIGIHIKSSDATDKDTESTKQKTEADKANTVAEKARADAIDETVKKIESEKSANEQALKEGKANALAWLEIAKDPSKTEAERKNAQAQYDGWVKSMQGTVSKMKETASEEKQISDAIGENDAKNEKKREADDRKHHSQMIKQQKDAFAKEKEQIENAYADQKTLIETQAIQQNEDQATTQYKELQLDVQHAQDLLDLAEKSGKGIAVAKLNLLKAQKAINDVIFKNEKQDMEAHYQDALDDATDDAKKTYNLKLKELNDLLQLEKDKGQSTVQTMKDIASLKKAERKREKDEINKELNAQQKTEESIEQKRVDAMGVGIDKELALQKLKHDKELAQLQDALDKKQATQKQYDELHRISEQQNANAIQDIYKKQGQQYMQDLKDANVFVAKNGQERVAAIKGFLLQELTQYLITKYAEVSATEATEGQKTAITLGGIASRVAATAGEIASDIASAAASAFSAVVNTIRWITTIFPFPFSLALIPAGIAAVYGLYKGAKSLFKFAEGGIVDKPTNFTFGDGQQGQAGEAGKEAIIPLDKLPETMARIYPRPALSNVSVDHTGALVKQLETANAKLTEIHTAALQQPPPATIDGYKMDLSIQKSQTRVNLAKLT
ncbi:MAG: hypothetical protein KGH93_03295 [Patescibacteria group bacterium]|nr:hypothetical protein [Patescibacteria group bacterium]